MAIWLISVLFLLPTQDIVTKDTPPVIVFWSHDERDENDNPDRLQRVQYAITHESVEKYDVDGEIMRDMVVELSTRWEVVLADHGVPFRTISQLRNHYRADVITPLLVPLPFAGEYALWVRVCDQSENWSDWGRAERPIEVLDVVPPKPPEAIGFFVLEE